MGSDSSLMLQGGQIQQKLNRSDVLLQQTSIISGVKRPNSASKSRSGSSTLMSCEIETTGVANLNSEDSALLNE